jgi:hypothetical protein
MKKKVEVVTVPNRRLPPTKPIHPCSDFLSDPRFFMRITLHREELDHLHVYDLSEPIVVATMSYFTA